jgi:hypothetical protein
MGRSEPHRMGNLHLEVFGVGSVSLRSHRRVGVCFVQVERLSREYPDACVERAVIIENA